MSATSTAGAMMVAIAASAALVVAAAMATVVAAGGLGDSADLVLTENTWLLHHDRGLIAVTN